MSDRYQIDGDVVTQTEFEALLSQLKDLPKRNWTCDESSYFDEETGEECGGGEVNYDVTEHNGSTKVEWHIHLVDEERRDYSALKVNKRVVDAVHSDVATAAGAVHAEHAAASPSKRALSLHKNSTQKGEINFAKSASESPAVSTTIEKQNLLLTTDADTNSKHHDIKSAEKTEKIANISNGIRKDHPNLSKESPQTIDGVTRNFLTNDELPFVTSSSLPGIGGRLKAKEHHFVVTEIPLFECDNKIDRYGGVACGV